MIHSHPKHEQLLVSSCSSSCWFRNSPRGAALWSKLLQVARKIGAGNLQRVMFINVHCSKHVKTINNLNLNQWQPWLNWFGTLAFAVRCPLIQGKDPDHRQRNPCEGLGSATVDHRGFSLSQSFSVFLWIEVAWHCGRGIFVATESSMNGT